MINISAAAITDIGRVRKTNEDRFLCDEGHGFFAVADGIGGLPYGARASQTGIESLRRALLGSPSPTLLSIETAVQKANKTVSNLGKIISPKLGIGSTLTCGVLDGDQLIIGHVGDSCCWELSGDQVKPLTSDHNMGQALAEHFVDHPLADDDSFRPSTLTQCLGQPLPVHVDSMQHQLIPDTKIFFASDGIANILSRADIAQTFATKLDLADQLKSLIDQVNERGAPDNATAVVLAVS
jgi:serine/threonine protein phosphatase PrpC